MGDIFESLGKVFSLPEQDGAKKLGVYEDAADRGEQAALEDLCDGTPDGWKDRETLYKEYNETYSPDDFSESPSIFEDVPVPTSPNPFAYGVKVALEPVETNSGEAEYFGGREDYIDGYQDSYQNIITDAAEREAPTFDDVGHHEQEPIDCGINSVARSGQLGPGFGSDNGGQF